jgi:predicted Fe-Mo cluster-binding NifX family protein
MKIAFAVTGHDLASSICSRFGESARFLVFDTEKRKYVVVFNPAMGPTEHAGIETAEAVIRAGAEAVVVGECGPKAAQVLSSAGMAVHRSESATVMDVLDQYYRESA